MVGTDDTDSRGSHIAAKRSWGCVEYGCLEDGSSPAKEFVNGLADGDKAKLAHLFEKLAETGKIFNTQKFRHEQGKIYSFKAGQVRIACFRIARRWILTHGFNKKQDRWPRSELERAENIMNRINTLEERA